MTRHAPTSKVKTVSAPERPETLTEQAYKQVEELIVTLRLKPGHVLSEQSLSASLGIGRTPIREALQKLALEGLVTILPRKGILVSEINPHSQLRVLEARREIERLLSRASAERATEEEKQRFLAIARGKEKAARTNNDNVFMRRDRAPNQLIVHAPRNDYAAPPIKFLQSLLPRI